MEITLIDNISKSELDEISGSNKQYAIKPHIDILVVCVDKEYQGKGYAQIYQHFGCELYNQTLASNGVTRYNLVWMNDK